MVELVSGRWRYAFVAGACALATPLFAACDSSEKPPTIPDDLKEIAPGPPGETLGWAPANKEGFGTAKKWDSKVWFTLAHGELTEVFYPDLGTPAVRNLVFIVTDGDTFAEKEHITEKGFGEASVNGIPYDLDDPTEHRIELPDPRSLTFRQINVAKSGKYRITKIYVTDPDRSTLLVKVLFESLGDKPLQLYLLYDPALSNNGNDDSGFSDGVSLWAFDEKAASAVMAQPPFVRASTGYFGTSDGWKDLSEDKQMNWSYRYAPAGNIVQMAKTALDGKNAQSMTVAVGFGTGTAEASKTAIESLKVGFDEIAQDYSETWHTYLATLRTPNSVAAEPLKSVYDFSLMVLAAGEDKLNGGAFIAAPAMPWLWGRPPPWTFESDAYHLVWPRDLYQIATAMYAAGDVDAAKRAVDFIFKVQQRPDGSFTQNTSVDGTVKWNNIQLDEVAFPIALAHQIGHHDAFLYQNHIKKAADYIVAHGPRTRQERWENQDGYSPATIAAEIAGLLSAGAIARTYGDVDSALKYEQTADRFAREVDSLTLAQQGPLSDKPYYLRITKSGNPSAAEHYGIGDGGPSSRDQRLEVDMSFLELVRLGIKDAMNPNIVNSIEVGDRALMVTTPGGNFWRRFPSCGYGETAEGGPWFIAPQDSGETLGRAWPLLAGERGEYALLAGRPADSYLTSIANTANQGLMMPEQVWDDRPPVGKTGFIPGKGTYSATPLLWTHAQFVRLALSIDAKRPVETLDIVACRYQTSACPR